MCSCDGAVPASAAGTDAYHSCPSCGGIFLADLPTAQTNAVFEGPPAVARQQALEEGRRGYFLRHLMRIEKRLGPSVQNWRLMEIGCGSGVLLQTAIARGWQANALEYSEDLAAVARRMNPSAVITVTDASQYTEGAADYDAVMALDVLEHVLDPGQLLTSCWTLLKPGGLLLLQTPNTRSLRHRLQGAAWEMRDPAQHLNLFSPAGLRALLTRTGFGVVQLQTVSGSGLERGLARAPAVAKQWVLDRGKLGNALYVLARRA
jgi:SAM-dependent methyltransferase